ncbi:hypothetical protein COCNU_03G000250 [Cocos nucifera]|uniref:Uncharacterized protein n=1 Tax=Cocos nucifera TaxID=13894 RepID=A0A8K0I200_COCNU|nr:hypothetical protein COCNU_03G000250 [Cocos nucifera]
MKGDIGPVVEKRAREVSNFLEMLRSASGEMESFKTRGTSHSDWKIKQDADHFRVMHREGPHGTPFCTLLTEGYVDGPIDVCGHSTNTTIQNYHVHLFAKSQNW